MMQQFTEGIDKVYANLDEGPDARQDQQIFDILSDMEADIGTGEYSQEEIVDTVTNNVGGEEASTELGAQVEDAVEKFYFQLGLDSIPPDRRSRDYLAQHTDSTLGINAAVEPTKVPAKVPGEAWVHTDDDFNWFLEALVKKGWTGRQIADVVIEPRKYRKEYSAYLQKKGKQVLDPYL